MKKRSNISKYLFFLMQFVLFGNLYTQTVGFVPDASGNYYGAFSEGTDGTIYVAIGGVTGAVTITFYVKIEDEAPDYGTANLSNHSHGNLHLDDYSYMYWNSTTSGSPNGNTTMTVQITVDANGNYPVTLDIIQDYRYEGGSGGTPETIKLYLQAGTGCTLASGANEYEYRITDDDQVPVYEFTESSTHTIQEDHNGTHINSSGSVIAVAHADGNTYYAGPDDFTFTYTIANGTTADSDHKADNVSGRMVGTYTISEWNGARTDNEIDYYVNYDNYDEPNETFTITLSESDANGDLGTNNVLNCIIVDDVTDEAPYVKFRDADQTVSENGAPSVTVVGQLQRASGYDNVSVGYVLTGTTAVGGHGDGTNDHTRVAGTLTF